MKFCKQQFTARHGISHMFMYDNGLQLISSDFACFAETWQLALNLTRTANQMLKPSLPSKSPRSISQSQSETRQYLKIQSLRLEIANF